VNQRFQIEDLIVQDASGVVFRAVDLETGQPAAVRRLFPFGVNGGGLDEAEQASYLLSIEKIQALQHPALRGILQGGIDPVDGLPYVATEWVEGATLQSFVDHAALSSAEATYLITQALEICELLSHTLGREAVWIETQLSSIVVGAAETGRGFTFWVAPMKWLGKSDGQRGLEPLITLTEEVLGWRGKAVADHDAGGLGAWLIWLRLSAASATLQQAREKLASSLGSSAPPSPVRRAVRQAERGSPAKLAKRKSSLPFILAATTGLGVLALGGYALIRWNESRQPKPPVVLVVAEVAPEEVKPAAPKKAPKVKPEPEPEPTPAPEPEPTEVTKIEKAPEPKTPTGETPEQKASRLATEFTDLAVKETRASEVKATEQKAAVAAKNGTFTIADTELIATQDGKKVSLTGVLVGLKTSTKGKTRYLLFSEKAADGEVRGSIVVSRAAADLSEENLKPLIGKKIKITGEVFMESTFDSKKRPNVVVENRAAIELQ
jgi:hypothetical protein